jgi:hypothetical protein
LHPAEIEKFLAEGKPFAVRLKIENHPCASTIWSVARSSSLPSRSATPFWCDRPAASRPASRSTTTW